MNEEETLKFKFDGFVRFDELNFDYLLDWDLLSDETIFANREYILEYLEEVTLSRSQFVLVDEQSLQYFEDTIGCAKLLTLKFPAISFISAECIEQLDMELLSRTDVEALKLLDIPENLKSQLMMKKLLSDIPEELRSHIQPEKYFHFSKVEKSEDKGENKSVVKRKRRITDFHDSSERYSEEDNLDEKLFERDRKKKGRKNTHGSGRPFMSKFKSRNDDAIGSDNPDDAKSTASARSTYWFDAEQNDLSRRRADSIQIEKMRKAFLTSIKSKSDSSIPPSKLSQKQWKKQVKKMRKQNNSYIANELLDSLSRHSVDSPDMKQTKKHDRHLSQTAGQVSEDKKIIVTKRIKANKRGSKRRKKFESPNSDSNGKKNRNSARKKKNEMPLKKGRSKSKYVSRRAPKYTPDHSKTSDSSRSNPARPLADQHKKRRRRKKTNEEQSILAKQTSNSNVISSTEKQKLKNRKVSDLNLSKNKSYLEAKNSHRSLTSENSNSESINNSFQKSNNSSKSSFNGWTDLDLSGHSRTMLQDTSSDS